jgi:YHS domain-containing protein
MNGQFRQAGKLVLLVCFVVTSLLLARGCKKSEPASTETAVAESEAVAGVEQTMCPVMGGAINKQFYTEYRGKKVYFCCPGCKEQFEGDPEKYIAKLPQFKEGE